MTPPSSSVGSALQHRITRPEPVTTIADIVRPETVAVAPEPRPTAAAGFVPAFPGIAQIALTHTERTVDGSSLPRVATELYGAWNDTVLDLVQSSNPDAGDLSQLSGSHSLRFPELRRNKLIVRNEDGRHMVYVGSFRERGEAERQRDAVARLWPDVRLIEVIKPDGRFQRLYIDNIGSESAAHAIADTMWFRDLPQIS